MLRQCVPEVGGSLAQTTASPSVSRFRTQQLVGKRRLSHRFLGNQHDARSLAACRGGDTESAGQWAKVAFGRGGAIGRLVGP
jgi:hypothetical protein